LSIPYNIFVHYFVVLFPKMAKKRTYTVEFEHPTAKNFVRKLIHWNHTANHRHMPWKGEKDPYKIWLSEIILQQTRVEQGLGYYHRFIETYPTVHHLANAPEQEVYKLWEGLGYYSRCRNLIHTAKYISRELGGVFPADYEAILALKGVGAYTAAAIASFAYNKPYAVLDGNVFRVLSRIFYIDQPIDTTEGKNYFAALAQSLLPTDQPGEYNQAIMDFGASVCKPSPDCAACFFNRHCKAFLLDRQLTVPVKRKRTSVRERWFNYLVLEHEGAFAVRQRLDKDIWQNLYEFLLLETAHQESSKEVLSQWRKSYGVPASAYKIITPEHQTVQRLSHQLIHFSFIHLRLHYRLTIRDIQWVPVARLHQYPFPRTLQGFVHTLQQSG
jgi:A/G-specific adenine glycosylase